MRFNQKKELYLTHTTSEDDCRQIKFSPSGRFLLHRSLLVDRLNDTRYNLGAQVLGKYEIFDNKNKDEEGPLLLVDYNWCWHWPNGPRNPGVSTAEIPAHICPVVFVHPVDGFCVLENAEDGGGVKRRTLMPRAVFHHSDFARFASIAGSVAYTLKDDYAYLYVTYLYGFKVFRAKLSCRRNDSYELVAGGPRWRDTPTDELLCLFPSLNDKVALCSKGKVRAFVEASTVSLYSNGVLLYDGWWHGGDEGKQLAFTPDEKSLAIRGGSYIVFCNFFDELALLLRSLAIAFFEVLPPYLVLEIFEWLRAKEVNEDKIRDEQREWLHYDKIQCIINTTENIKKLKNLLVYVLSPPLPAFLHVINNSRN